MFVMEMEQVFCDVGINLNTIQLNFWLGKIAAVFRRRKVSQNRRAPEKTM
jgi:hypothetical protein